MGTLDPLIKKLKILYVICCVLQVVGLIMIIYHELASESPVFLPILIGIAGASAFVRLFLLTRSIRRDQVSAIVSLGVILYYCAMA